MKVEWKVFQREADGDYFAELRIYPDEYLPLNYQVSGRYSLPCELARQCAENTTMRASYLDAFMRIVDFVRDEQREAEEELAVERGD